MCCEAIYQNLDCGFVLKKGYANLQLYLPIQTTIQKNLELLAALEQLNNMHIAWVTFILPRGMAT